MPRPVTTRSLLVALGVSLPGIGLAQADTSEWLCETCPFEDGYRASYDVGATYVSDDAARFGNATGYDEKGAYAIVAGEGSYVKDAYRLNWYLEDLGLESRAFEMDGGVQGKFGFNIGYREMPYRLFDTTQTIFAGSDYLSLPSGWVPSGSTAGFTQLASSLYPQDVGSDRTILDLGADWTPLEKFDVYADFRRQNNEGIKISSGASFTQASLLPQWFDYETDRIDAGVRYATDRASIGFAYYGSFFTNNHASLTWETPFATSPGMEVLRKSTAPSNDFQQFAVSGSYRASIWDTVIAFSLASGSGEQNEALLPYTINPDLVTSPLPITSLNAEVDTSNYALTISSRPLPKGRVRLAYRYDDRDNKTMQAGWNRVIVDGFVTNDNETNTPYSFERTQLGISGDYVIWKDIQLSGGVERKELTRDYQEVAEQTTDEAWGQLRWRPLDWLDLRVKGGESERDINRYDETVAVSLGQNPLMRKYNLAYRYRSYGELIAAVSPAESRWSMSATALYAEDTYNQSSLGMKESDETRATLDLSFAMTDSLSAFVLFGWEEINALQLGSEQFASRDWSADHEDSFDHYGFGARWQQPEGKFDLQFDYNRAEGTSAILMNSMSGGASQMPDLESTLDSMRIDAGYRWNERLQGFLDLRYESFTLTDWAMVAPDTLPSVLTLGEDPYDYDVWAIGVGIRYSFGGAAAEAN
ncbi:MAG: MtrB/PioB family decaheme-associated outer membrane protein [Gammaproteobacteria bacterium]|nr:MtrB/PioB family decaheme-associated outer membrane protein [Gammaproteobacteria bacterium]MDH5262555.1 MtrB/PioB family decaheme-associated outer membrane protein [Gammaproteobacteria bacterium]MDH5584120.1 MtrB/PioB family decaheme-associated outer membrane protein [Gammaproteobacteria bacterium]